ncbi:MAG: type IV pilus assembly protein PilM [Bdellovibrionales bacterium]|nr:type IV pilus assembly protein PilM [Bdellovibrionales bacterium]
MLFGSKKVVGIDVGTSSIKLAEMDVSGKSAKLTHFSMTETPTSAVSNGDIVDNGAISTAVRHLIAESKVKRKQAATGLWGSSVIVKKINIPKMDKSLVAEQIRWEAEQYIPFELNEVNLDFHILRDSLSSDSMDILLIAAKHEQIFKMVEIIQGAGLTCSHLDINGFALSNLYLQNFGNTGEAMHMVLNIGANYTNFIVINGKEVIFCRDIPVGGSVYTSEIQKGMGISPAEAESLKLSLSRGGSVPDEVSEIISSTNEMVVDEIQGSLDFFINTTPGAHITNCFVSGGGSRTKNLRKSISEAISIPCDRFNPFQNIKVKLNSDYAKEIGDFASIALGLALRKVGDE